MTSPMATRVRRAFATAAIALVLLYMLIDVMLQFLPPHYSVLSDAESDFVVGPFGWVMNLNFLARALMSGCLAVAGLCTAALVFFPTDVNRPAEYGMTPRTTVGIVHAVFATSGLLAALLGGRCGRARAIVAFPGRRAGPGCPQSPG